MLIVEESYLISDSFDHRFACVLRLCQFEQTHKENILISDLRK